PRRRGDRPRGGRLRGRVPVGPAGSGGGPGGVGVFTDRARIFVQGGAGGDGVVAFRREAHVPRGGPDGGDGGRGADVVLVSDPSLRDLQSFRRRAHYKAPRGGHGEGSERHGASPAALEVAVPPGTSVSDPER